MNHRRITAALAVLALGSATMATAGAAQAAEARATVHGCPAGSVCEYVSKTAYRNDNPTVADADVPGYFSGGTANTVTVNNTAKYYSSEGYIELRIIKGAQFCFYMVDPADEQAPGATENPADGAEVTAIATATTAQAADSDMILPLSDCD